MALKDLLFGQKKKGPDQIRPANQDTFAPNFPVGNDPWDTGTPPILHADQYCDIAGVPPVYDDRDSLDAFQISDEWPVPPPGFGGPGNGNWEFMAVMDPMTGYTQYTYYHGKQEIGGAMAHTLPGFPADIRGSGLSLSTQFDATLFPGCFREIRDELSNSLWGKVIYYGKNTHILQAQGVEIIVKSQEGEWRFLQDGKPLGILKREDSSTAKQLILEPKGTLDDDLALLLMSFPLLQISW